MIISYQLILTIPIHKSYWYKHYRIHSQLLQQRSRLSICKDEDGQIKSLPNRQQQPLAQVLKPTHAGPVGSSSKNGDDFSIQLVSCYFFCWVYGCIRGWNSCTSQVLCERLMHPREKRWCPPLNNSRYVKAYYCYTCNIQLNGF